MNTETDERLKSVAERWDRTTEQRLENPIQGWMDSPIVLEDCVYPKLGAGPGRHWLPALVERHGIPKDGRWLSLGCGAAGTEIAASGWGLFGSMVALDASPASLQAATDAARKQTVTNISFGTVDLENLRLPHGAFDVVLVNMSLHHVKGLGQALAEVDRTLRDDGWFVVHEFIGPRQFQFTDVQLRYVREMLATLPESYRRDSATGQVKKEYVRLPVEHWNVADPSEAIRSDRIVPELETRFRIVERLDYGGTILSLLLEHIVHNFDARKEADREIIRALGREEDRLIRRGALPSDYTLITAKKRRSLLRRGLDALRRGAS